MIARNLLNGLKTCWEVFQYMNNSENKLSLVSDGVNGMFQGSFKGDGHTVMVSILTLFISMFICVLVEQ